MYQHTEDAAAVRQLTDSGSLVLAQSGRDEVAEGRSVRRQHPKGTVPSVGQVDGQVDDPLQQRR